LSVAKELNDNKMIKYHQIKGLREVSKYNHVIAGFLINFRTDGTERTYFQTINNFVRMMSKTNKSSFNEIDLIIHNAVKVNGELMRVNYKWDIESLLETGGK
jgi:penicillin-binding protein-related factor A (putative recombinase)